MKRAFPAPGKTVRLHPPNSGTVTGYRLLYVIMTSSSRSTPRAAAFSATLILAFLLAGHLSRTGVNDSPEPMTPLSDAMAAMQFLTDQRAYPHDDIPPGAYSRAFEQVEPALRMNRQPGAAAGTLPVPDPWTSMGPKNLGGRTIALAINPDNTQVIYAGGATGGLWRTDTGGIGASAWRYIDTGYPVLGVHAIAIDPADTSVIYIGTGEVYNRAESMGSIYIRTTRGSYGIGLLKSTDSGQTWTKSIDWSYDERRGVHEIIIDPHDHSRIWAGTSEGVYRSTDGGATWGDGTPVLPVQMAVDLAVDPIHSDTLYASCGNLETPSDGGIGIYRSYDGGDTWTKLNDGTGTLPASWTGKTMLDIWQASPNVIYADVANMFSDSDPTGVGLYRSVDYGDTWELLTNNTDSCTDPLFQNELGTHGYHRIAKYQGWFSHYVIVHPADSTKVIVGGVDSYRSTDGGRNFVRISRWNSWYRGTIPAGQEEGPTDDYSHADHHCFARHPTEPNTIYWGNDGGVFYTNDFGDHFYARNGGYQTAQFYYGFSTSPITADLAIGGLQDNSTVVYEGTTDWKRVFGGDGGATALHATDPNYVIGSSQRGAIFRSFDRGTTRIFTSSSAYYDGEKVCFIAPIAQAPSNPAVLYTGRTRIYRATGYAADSNSWFLTSATALNGAPVVSIAVAATNASRLWAGTVPDPPLEAGVFRSDDAAGSWTDVTGDLPDRYPMDITAAYWDEDTAYVTFSGFGTPHLYRTTDGGTTWTALGVGQLPDIPTSAFVIDPYNRNHLYVGNDFGVWFSPDEGETWEPFSTGLPTAVQVLDLVISPVNWKLRAATHGVGAWERTLVSAAAAEGDVIPPFFDFGLHRNSVLTDHLDLYFVPSEVLPVQPTANVNGGALLLSTMSTTEGNIYTAPYTIGSPGSYTITIEASDFAGNDSTSTFGFEAALLGGSEGTALSTADGGLLLSMPAGALPAREYVVAWRVPLVEGSPGTPVRRGGSESVRFEPPAAGEEEVLEIWSLQPAGKALHRRALLALTLDPARLGSRSAGSLVLERLTGGGWEQVPAWIDADRHRIEASITELGTFRVRSTSDPEDLAPFRSGLEQNYPNPFNGSTTIRFSLARASDVQLHVLNARGQRVRTLLDAPMGPGSHTVTWRGRDDGGRDVATGVYLIALHADGRRFIRKALYIR